MMATAKHDTMPGAKPGRTRRAGMVPVPDLIQGKSPAPINIDPGEPLAHTRIRALQLAQFHELIGLYIGILDAAHTEPTRQQYFFLPAGVTLADLKRGQDPWTLHADEVLPFCYGLSVQAGLTHVFAYREGLPGWTPARKPQS